ncbi:MAG: ABC transporter ATP-binding protein [Rhodospirillales bacterium]|nr:ABC transporter ATP-binding protein [Rhodospirillales bacterium]
MSGTERSVVLRLDGITKKFGDFAALDGISLDIHDGEFLTVVGPSGSGKTTMIRLLVGMDSPTGGDIYLKGERVNDVPANKRPTCMVFQSLALFPHRTVGQNIEFPLKIRKVPPVERRARAMELIALLHLPAEYYDKNVMQCSGGEQQRVALARALAFDPEILFFDEPLSALDFRLRKMLEKELKDLHRQTGKTFVYITHSLEEAMVMSDRIAIMRVGRIEQIGTPDEIYNAPTNRFVAEFMGEVNLFHVRCAPDGRLEVPEIGVSLACPETVVADVAEATLMVRPEVIRFLGPGEKADCVLEGTVFNEYVLGSRVQYSVRVGGKTLSVERLREDRYTGALDTGVVIGWNARDSRLLGPGS